MSWNLEKHLYVVNGFIRDYSGHWHSLDKFDGLYVAVTENKHWVVMGSRWDTFSISLGMARDTREEAQQELDCFMLNCCG